VIPQRSHTCPPSWDHRLIVLLSVFILLWVPGHSLASPPPQGPTYQIQVDGLSCPFCTYGIEKKFLELDGVKQVQIDLPSGSALVIMKAGRNLDRETARKTVQAAGFTLRSFQPVERDSTGKQETNRP